MAAGSGDRRAVASLRPGRHRARPQPVRLRGAIVLDPLILMLALLAGVGIRRLNYPPMLGYLLAGFILNFLPLEPSDLLEEIADAGVTLLLFTIGLKLDLRQLAAPQVWAVTSAHMLISIAVAAPILYAGFAIFAGREAIDSGSIWLIAFALSFSSTVFAVKVFEDRGEMTTLHARIAIGILIFQDLAAVVFLGFSSGKTPDFSLLMLVSGVALLLSRPLLVKILQRSGHGELLLLCGITAALGGSALFEAFNVKGDLGALAMGVLLAGNAKSSELAGALLDLKDLLLVGFFVSIGLSGQPDGGEVLLALGLALLAIFKPLLYFALLTALRLRARTALLTSLALFGYSEFGLIVASLAADARLLDESWIVILALAMAFSFLLSAPLNARAYAIYHRYCALLRRWERGARLPEETHEHPADARVLILGMGRIGVGAYEYLTEVYGEAEVSGVEARRKQRAVLQEMGIRAVIGDATDEDFWREVDLAHIELIMVSLSKHSENKAVCELLLQLGYQGHLAVIATHPDQRRELRELGCIAFNLYQEAGYGFAEHVCMRIQSNAEEKFTVSHFT